MMEAFDTCGKGTQRGEMLQIAGSYVARERDGRLGRDFLSFFFG